MTEQVRLYDIRDKDYPNNRGDTFLSLQVFECWVCGSTTNQVIMGGYPGYGIRAICPNSREGWHHDIEDKINLARKPHPTFYQKEIDAEIQDMKERRKSSIKNDVVGEPDFNLKRWVTNTWSFKKTV